MEQERTYKWIQERIRELHAGTLSEADRFRLQQLAKDDPFVQDALDGYQDHAHHDHTPHLKILSQRIKHRGEARRRKLFPTKREWVLQAVAASLVLILVTWTVIYYLGKNENAVLVSSETQILSADSTSDEILNTSPANQGLATATEEISDQEMSSPEGLRANAQAGAKEAESKAKAKAEEPVVADVTTKESESSTLSDYHVSPAGEEGADDDQVRRDEGSYANSMSKEMMDKRVTGKVVDHYGNPIIGAMISIANSNLASTSNTNGQFEIFLPEKKSTVEVNATGYADTSLVIKQGQEDVVIALTEGRLTQGHVAYDAKSRTNKLSAKKVTSNAFLDYLKSNSKYPVLDNYRTSAKEVVITFDVSQNNRPTNVLLKKSSADKKYIAEAIRLIEKGPDWICEEGYPCKREYTIYFK